MQKNILVAPVGPSLHKRSYSKEYYLLRSVARANPSFSFDGYVHRIEEKPPDNNINAFELKPDASRTRFRVALFKTVANEIAKSNCDIYHHVKLSYFSFNPVIASGKTSEIPTIIGPAYPPHMVDPESMKSFLNRMCGFEWPQGVVTKSMPAINKSKKLLNHVRRPLFAKTLQNADKVIAIDEATAEMYEKFIPRSKIEILPFGVAVNRFNTGDPSQATDIVAIGSHRRRKGFKPLLEAWSRINNAFPNVTLQIYGDGPIRDEIEKKSMELGINNSVKFNGYVDHKVIREQLANARAFVHPTLSEAQAHVRLEAMASACPVIATNIRGTEEMIRDEIEGLVVPINSEPPLADAITRLLSDPYLAKELGENAHQRAKEKYDWDYIGNEMIKIYKDVL